MTWKNTFTDEDVDVEEIDYLIGENGSSAQKMFNSGKWIVKGEHDVLFQAEPSEFGYRIDLKYWNVSNVLDLPKDWPIYAGVYSWEDQHSSLTDDFETVSDLKEDVETSFDSFLNSLTSDEKKHIAKIDDSLREKIIRSLAQQIFYAVDWTALSVETDEIFDDIRDCLENGEYDAYPLFFID